MNIPTAYFCFLSNISSMFLSLFPILQQDLSNNSSYAIQARERPRISERIAHSHLIWQSYILRGNFDGFPVSEISCENYPESVSWDLSVSAPNLTAKAIKSELEVEKTKR